MKKINVVGTSASGKSTFSKKLSAKLNIDYVEMDALFWGKNWTHLGDDEFLEKIDQVTQKEYWILDGNYSRTIPLKWSKADTVIWIDYSFSRTLLQSIKRAISRIITKKELWPDTNNRETFRKSFLSKDSVVLWMLTNYFKTKKKYEIMLSDKEYSHINFVRLKSPKEVNLFLDKLKK